MTCNAVGPVHHVLRSQELRCQRKFFPILITPLTAGITVFSHGRKIIAWNNVPKTFFLRVKIWEKDNVTSNFVDAVSIALKANYSNEFEHSPKKREKKQKQNKNPKKVNITLFGYLRTTTISGPSHGG